MKLELNELDLFAGIGGGLLGGQIDGFRTVCAVERNAYAALVLSKRQAYGLLPIFPIWSDVTSFDGRPWRGIVNLVSGGFPCQDISVAGKGVGINGKRSGLWREMVRIVRDVQPLFVFVENSPALIHRGLGVVLGDLAKLGYNAVWRMLSAADCGANHERNRIWILAYSARLRRNPRKPQPIAQRWIQSPLGGCSLANPDSLRKLQPQGSQPEERGWLGDCGQEISYSSFDEMRLRWGFPREKTAREKSWKDGFERTDWWKSEPSVGRVAHGIPHRVDRLAGLGNAQVPYVAATAFRLLYREMMMNA